MSETMKPKLLIVEDDEGLQRQLRWAYDDYEVLVAGDRPTALTLLRAEEPAVITLDLGLPPDPDGVSEGFATMAEILTLKPDAKVIVASGHGARESAMRAIAGGAYDFYQKPVDIDELGMIVRRAFHLHAIEADNARLAAMPTGGATVLGTMVTAAPEMLKVARTIERVATADVSVMLLGASGTGKELLARGVHESSNRRTGPFVAINCGAIPETLLEAELFGHEKGAFTGAVKTNEGKIELAQGGSLFLDEVGDIPLPLQVKLLRFLQERRHDRGRLFPGGSLLPPGGNRHPHPHARRTAGRRGLAGPAFRGPLCGDDEPRGQGAVTRCASRNRSLVLAGQCARTRKPYQTRRDHGRWKAGDGRRSRSWRRRCQR
jgi:two-component system, NtrC family, response regulator